MNLSFVSRFRGVVVFVLLAGMVTVIAATVCASVRQNYRNNANDPQIDATEQIADLLNQDAPAEAILGQGGSIDIAKNLSIFIIIFDKDGKPLAGSGKLNNAIPVPPQGVFDYLKNHDEQKFTWEPQKGVRLAAVIRKANADKGFALAARSLREVEKREKQLSVTVAIAWGAMMVLSALLSVVLSRQNTNITLVEEVINVETKPEGEI